MKKLCATTLVACAAAVGIVSGVGTASAAIPTIADLAIYRLPSQPGLACRIAVVNNGPNVVQALLMPLDPMAKGYRKDLGPVNPGQSVGVDFIDCTRPSYSPNYFLYVQGSGYDPNPLNNVLPLDS